jgi:hypothetical protein
MSQRREHLSIPDNAPTLGVACSGGGKYLCLFLYACFIFSFVFQNFLSFFPLFIFPTMLLLFLGGMFVFCLCLVYVYLCLFYFGFFLCFSGFREEIILFMFVCLLYECFYIVLGFFPFVFRYFFFFIFPLFI